MKPRATTVKSDTGSKFTQVDIKIQGARAVSADNQRNRPDVLPQLTSNRNPFVGDESG